MNKSLGRSVIGGLFLILATAGAFADGGGGMLMGYQISRYPFLDNYEVAGNNFGLGYYGGFGYGVSNNRGIVGGFGIAIMDMTGESGIVGGFGGIISGIRIFKSPINVSLVSWTGFGGISTGRYRVGGRAGYFALMEEVNLEIGLPVFKWFMPTVTLGYQVTGSLIPGIPFSSFLSYTPVAGFRIQWGKFY